MKKVYHLQLKLPFKHKQVINFYFSSIAAIYDRFKGEDLGVSYSTLRHYGLKNGPYENEKIIVTLGLVSRKPKKQK